MSVVGKKVAKLTEYQQNCGLNGLAHVIVENIDKIGASAHAASLDSLSVAFAKFYNLPAPFARAQMIAHLKSIKNPVHLEVVLGPVLRTMLVKARHSRRPELGYAVDAVAKGKDGKTEAERLAEIGNPNEPLIATEVLYLADTFGIRVETYEDLAKPTDDALHGFRGRLGNIGAGAPLAILQLSQLEGLGHWNRFVDWDAARLAAHNKAHADRKYYDEKLIREQIANGIKNKLDLNAVFSAYDVSAPAGDTPPAMGGLLGKQMSEISKRIGSFFEGIGGGKDGKDSNGKMNPMTAMFSIFGFFAQMFTGMGILAKSVGKVMNPSMSLDEEDVLEHPSASTFKTYVDLIANDNQHILNTAWRKSPDSPEVWGALIKALTAKGHYAEVEALLKEKEEAVLDPADLVVAKLSEELNEGEDEVGKAKMEATLIAVLADGKRADEAKELRARLDAAAAAKADGRKDDNEFHQKIDFSKASEQYKLAYLKCKEQMYQIARRLSEMHRIAAASGIPVKAEEKKKLLDEITKISADFDKSNIKKEAIRMQAYRKTMEAVHRMEEEKAAAEAIAKAKENPEARRIREEKEDKEEKDAREARIRVLDGDVDAMAPGKEQVDARLKVAQAEADMIEKAEARKLKRRAGR